MASADHSSAGVIQVTVWAEHVQDREQDDVKAIYPETMHETIAAGLRAELGETTSVRTATLHDPDHGLGDAVLDATDVLLWWGHVAHDRVADERVDAVHRRVLAGMGFVALHSAHIAKPFVRLLGTGCLLGVAARDERELVWTVAPWHPIAAGVPQPIVIPAHETYGEHFDVPPPDELVFISNFSGGAVFRSGCCWFRGAGRVFFFSPGHETNPIYHRPEIRRVLANAVLWAANPTPSSAWSPTVTRIPESFG